MTEALAQTALLIGLGFGLKRRGFPDEFWSGLDRVVYWVFLPSLFFRVLARAQFTDVAVAPLAASVSLSILLVAGALLLLRPGLGVSNSAFTSVVQGTVRFNSYVALATVPAVFGESGLLLLLLLIAVVVPLVNIICVLVLSLYAEGAAPTLSKVTRSLVTNPLIIACLLGLSFNWLSLPLGLLDGLLEVLARAALPCGLLAVGAALRLGMFGHQLKPLSISTAARFVLLPLVSYGVATAFGLSGEARAVLVLFQV